MSTQTTSVGRRFRWPSLVVAVALVGIGAFTLRGGGSVTAPRQTPVPAAAQGTTSPSPAGERAPDPPELAQAVQSGQDRQLRLLDEAIANAKSRGNADPAYLSALENRRAALTQSRH